MVAVVAVAGVVVVVVEVEVEVISCERSVYIGLAGACESSMTAVKMR